MDSQTKKKKVPYYKKPENMPLEVWQTELRKQFAADQKFEVKNTGDHPVFSDFEVYNPESGGSYKVSIRDNKNSYDFCECPDFKINGLGTCKHIEYVMADLRRLKRNHKYFSQIQQPAYSSLSIHYGKERRIRLKTADGISFDGFVAGYFDDNGFLLPEKTNFLETFIDKAIGVDPGFRVYPDVYDYIREHKETERRMELVNRLFTDGINSDIFNGLINTDLYSYQKEGVIRIIEAGRILLADEMGLGKTIQAIAAIEIFARFLNVKKVLIVCPTSLKYQWKREIEKFTARDAAIVEGMVHKRRELYACDSFIKIISYGLCRNDGDLIGKWSPDMVIIDEAQRIKNWKTQTAKAVKKIDTEYALVLTGTPLENRIDELHSIVEFVDRYRLGPLFRFLNNHQMLDDHGKLVGYRNLRTINKTLEGILLRRTKKEIADQLPGRTDKNFFVELTKEQIKWHNDYYEMVCRMVNKWIKTGFLSEEERQRLLIGLNCMRMVSDSTYILDTGTNFGNKAGELKEFLSELTENPGNKIFIFSQWKRMFELIIRELEKMDLPYVYLNGDIPADKRNDMIERFRKEKHLRIFLSTDAGGVGVNLQSANILINVDLPWNPAVLEQRIGRIYRLGQKKQINVFNFISTGSIEHRILYLLDFKKSVFSGAIDEEGNDTVMLEGFLKSVRSLTEVQLDSPAVKGTTTDDKLRYNAELNVSGNDRPDSEHQPVITSGSGQQESSNTAIMREDNFNPGTGEDSCPENDQIVHQVHEPIHEYEKQNGKGVFEKVKEKIRKFFGKIFGFKR